MSTEPKAMPLDAPPDYPFPKTDEGLLPWSKALAQLEESRIYWLATCRPDGRPHVAPLWGGWLDNMLFFEGSPTTRWAQNLAANAAASINLESGIDVVIAEGAVDVFPLSDDLRARLIELWSVKYGQFGPQPDTEAMFRFVPRTVRAFGESLKDGARWVLNP